LQSRKLPQNKARSLAVRGGCLLLARNFAPTRWRAAHRAGDGGANKPRFRARGQSRSRTGAALPSVQRLARVDRETPPRCAHPPYAIRLNLIKFNRKRAYQPALRPGGTLGVEGQALQRLHVQSGCYHWDHQRIPFISPASDCALLGLAKSQQSVKTSFGKVLCELKAAELDFPSLVPKTGLYRQ
jgi:hypothetical protein